MLYLSIYVGFLIWVNDGYPNSWMAYFMENPIYIYKCMIWGYPHFAGIFSSYQRVAELMGDCIPIQSSTLPVISVICWVDLEANTSKSGSFLWWSQPKARDKQKHGCNMVAVPNAIMFLLWGPRHELDFYKVTGHSSQSKWRQNRCTVVRIRPLDVIFGRLLINARIQPYEEWFMISGSGHDDMENMVPCHRWMGVNEPN